MGNQIRESIKFQGEERLISIANSLKETVNDARQVQKEIDELNKKKLKIEVDENGFKIIKKGLDTIRQELSDQKIKKTDFFNNEGVQRDIKELMSTLDNAYDKIINKGQKLSQEETDIFVKSYAKLNQLGDKAGEDFAAKYHNLFDSFFNQLKTQTWDNKSFDPMSKDYYNSIVTPILESFTKEFVRRHVENIRDELAQRKYESNESQRNEIKGVKSEIDVARNNKREILRKGQEEVQGLLDGLNSQRLDGEVFNIDLSKFAEIQEAFRILIQLLTEANIDTIKLEDSFQQFTQGVYIPKEQVDGAKQSLSEANAEIEQLKEQVSQLQQLLSSAPSMDEFNKLKQDYEAAQEKIEQLTNSISNLMSLTENSVSSSEYQNMTQEATLFIEEWRKAQQELAEVKKQLAEIREERDRLLEEREALRQTKEGINKETDGADSKVSSKFKPSNLQSFIDLLSQIESHLHTLRDAFGSVDDNSGFKNIIDSITILLDKLSDIQNRFDSGILNVTVNKTGITAADTIVNEELERLMNKYNEFISIFGGESNLFNTISAYSASTIDFDKYYSSSALKDIVDPLQKVNRLQEFFKDIETSLQNLKGMKKVLRDDASILREQIKELETNSDAYDFINSSDGQSMAKGAIDQLKGRLKSINQLLKILRNAEKFEAPETSAEEISQKIKNENMNLLEEEDLEGLDKVVFQLERIAELLSEISQKDLLGNSVETLSKQLDDLIGKFQIVIETIQTTKTTSIANTTTTSANGINTLISSEEKARNAINETNTAIEKQNAESSQLGTQISQINTLADSNKDLAVSVNNVSDATNQVEKKTSILQRFFEWLGKIKDKFKDAFSINTNSNSAADGLEKQINAVDKASEKYNQSIDKLEKMAEKYRRVNQSEVNQTVDTGAQDKLQAELTETTQKAEEASKALKEEQQVSNAPLPFTVSESEIESINAVRDALNTVIKYIQLKNEMFQKEGQIVTGVTQSEVTDLTILLGWLWDIEKEVADIGAAFEKNLNYTPNLDIATLDKFITKIKNLKPDKLGLNLIGIYDWIDDFIKAMNLVKLDPNSFFGQLTEFFDKSEELKAIATIIKASKKEINNAKISANTSKEDFHTQQLKEYIELEKQRLVTLTEIQKLRNQGYTDQKVFTPYNQILDDIEKQKEAYKNIIQSEEDRKRIVEETAKAESDLAKAKEDFNRKQNAENKRNEAEQDRIANKEKSNYSKQGNLLKQINTWIKKNTVGYKAYQDQLDTLVRRLTSGAALTEDELREIKDSFTQITNEATVAGKTGISIIDMIKNRWKSVVAYAASFMSFYRVAGYVRTALTTIKDLDTQLVDLRKTTTMTSTELNDFYKASTDVGKELGVTTSEIISQAAAWSRLGYSSNEAATQMAALSSKFTSISPGMSTENATDYLVSTMKAFGIETDEVERKIMDNVNRIGNTFATTNAEIGEMLTRSSAAMKAANNTLEETIALETAAVEITRNAETTGTAFRTVSMRIRGLDEETEEALEDYDELKGKIADLTKTAKTPGGISLFTDESKTEFKSTYQFLKEISEIYHDISDADRATLLETIAGKRGGQVFAGLLDDFSQVDKALKEMEKAGGSADAEMDIIRDSIEFKMNALKQTWTGVLQDLIDRGTLGEIIDSLTTISDVIGGLVKNLGLVKTAIIGIGGVIGSQKLG